MHGGVRLSKIWRSMARRGPALIKNVRMRIWAGPENVRGDAKDWGEVHMWSRVAISPATAAMTAPVGSAGIRLSTWRQQIIAGGPVGEQPRVGYAPQHVPGFHVVYFQLQRNFGVARLAPVQIVGDIAPPPAYPRLWREPAAGPDRRGRAASCPPVPEWRRCPRLEIAARPGGIRLRRRAGSRAWPG